MKYKTADRDQCLEAFEYLTKLVGQEAVVEVKKINPNRSLNQNSYYHLLLGIFGLEFGWSIEEAKVLHKREVSPQIFVYEKNGVKFLRSSASLDTKQMSDAIEQFKKYAAEGGLYLPDANDNEKLLFYSNQIEQQSKYL